jgi:hypothetical protein
MMGLMPGVGKEMNLLNAKQSGMNSMLTVGGYIQNDWISQNTSATGFNAVPMSNGASFETTGTSANKLFFSDADLALTAAINPWLTSYIEMGAKNVGNSSSQSNVSMQDAYLVVGDLSKSLVYGVIGQKEIDFGSFASVNMYNSPLNRDFFEALGNTATIGLSHNGLNGTISLMNGGSTGADNKYTTNQNFASNYAANIGYGANAGELNWNIGTGYINGSRFLTSSGQTDGAWDVNAKLSLAGWDLLAEYVATAQKSNGATAYSPALSSSSQYVDAWDLGTAYRFMLAGLNSALSIDYSQASLASGADNLLGQLVAGYRIEPIDNVWCGLEYSYNQNGIDPASGALYGSNYHSNTVILDLTAAF